MGEQVGSHPHPAVRQGRPVAETRLLWPQTEAIKAFAARLEFGDADARTHLDAHLATLFRHYVSAETGIWHNQLGPDGQPLTAELPVRVLYHLMLAVAEVARVEKAVAARS